MDGSSPLAHESEGRWLDPFAVRSFQPICALFCAIIALSCPPHPSPCPRHPFRTYHSSRSLFCVPLPRAQWLAPFLVAYTSPTTFPLPPPLPPRTLKAQDAVVVQYSRPERRFGGVGSKDRPFDHMEGIKPHLQHRPDGYRPGDTSPTSLASFPGRKALNSV
jgi:hypothetical protein